MKYHIEKSIVINKAVNEVKPLVADFAKWNSWSPWNVLEPTCKTSTDGPVGAVGHTMSWEGEIIGAGSMTLQKVEGGVYEYDLQFLKPFKSKATTAFTLKEKGEQTEVTWTMDGAMPFFLAFMIPMLKMMVTMDYDRGLKMMKSIAETGSVDADTTNKGMVDFEGFSYVGIQRKLPIAQMREMQKDFETIIQDIVVGQGVSAKHWFALYPKLHAKEMSMTYIAAISDEQVDASKLGEQYVAGKIESGKMLEIHHRGAYDFLGNAWSMGMMYLRAKKIKQGGIPFEYYRNSPLEVQPNELETSIYFPVK